MIANRVSLFLSLVIAARPVFAYNTDVCCDLAKIDQAWVTNPEYPKDQIPLLASQTCGQTYSTGTPAAAPLHVNYTFCSSKCGGMGRSNFSAPSEWAAPVVQFLLPSVIFSLSIPRERVIDIDYTQMIVSHFKIENSFIQMTIFIVGFILVLLPVLVDSVLWIIVIVVGAGNMIVGGLYEAVIDYRILKYVKRSKTSNLPMKQELLATLACGNLQLSPHDTKATILKSLLASEHVDAEVSRSRLLNLIGAQSSFGGAIGSPVLFYLGAFVYTILDLKNNPSDQDNAISLGFGIEWMIIVHVAIISGTLLAANNPSTSSGITGTEHEAMKAHRSKTPEGWGWTGWSKTYDTEFQPVSIWDRGANKMEWIRHTSAWSDPRTGADFEKGMRFGGRSWSLIFFAAFLLIVIPPTSGGFVAFYTPPRGIACRSLSFILYGIGQLATTILATVRAAHPNKRSMQGWRFVAVSFPFWMINLVAAIGGTVMQISGVYRNCVCYALAQHWVNIKKNNPPIQVANDTQQARDASKYWIYMGVFATVFMAFNCYVGWWYQIFVRRKFTEAVEEMGNNGQSASAIPPPLAPLPAVPAGNLGPGDIAQQQTAQQTPVQQPPVQRRPVQQPSSQNIPVQHPIRRRPVQQSSSPTVLVTHPTLPPVSDTGGDFELNIMNVRSSSESAHLLVHGGAGDPDSSGGSDGGSSSSGQFLFRSP